MTKLKVQQDTTFNSMISPSGVIYELRSVTPDDAAEWLGRNPKNRRVRPAPVARFARDMVADAWFENGDAIRFDTQGNLLDGQHRLHAILESGVTIMALVVSGLPPEAQDTVDDGSKRTLADRFDFHGESNSTLTASVVRRIVMWTQGFKHNAGTFQVSPAEALRALKEDKGIRCAVEATVTYKSMKLLPPSVIGLCWWLFNGIDEEQNAEFFARLYDGAMLPAKHPVLALRNRLVDLNAQPGRVPESYILAITIKAWNFYRSGTPVTALRFGNNEQFPEPR